MKSFSPVLRVLTPVALRTTSIINVAALGTLPVFRSRHKTTRRSRLVTLFTVITPVIIWKGTTAAEPVVRIIGGPFTPSLLGTRARTTVVVASAPLRPLSNFIRGRNSWHDRLEDRKLRFNDAWNPLNEAHLGGIMTLLNNGVPLRYLGLWLPPVIPLSFIPFHSLDRHHIHVRVGLKCPRQWLLIFIVHLLGLVNRWDHRIHRTTTLVLIHARSVLVAWHSNIKLRVHVLGLRIVLSIHRTILMIYIIQIKLLGGTILI